MRRTLRLLTLLPFLLAPTPARAADWVSVAKFSDVELEFDLAGAVREGDFSRAWDRATYQADQGGPGSGDGPNHSPRAVAQRHGATLFSTSSVSRAARCHHGRSSRATPA